jgi:hypothetical protein
MKKQKTRIKQAIISLDVMPYDVYKRFSQMSHLQNKSNVEIWQHYPMIGKKYNPNTMVKQTSIIESYLMLNYLNKLNVKCRFWYNNSLFIFNDNLYRIVEDKVVKIDLNGMYFFSFRESFRHPFFQFLEILLKKHNGKLAKPNKATMTNVGCMNKMYGFIQLYKSRNKYLQDVIIPYNIKQNEYAVFLKFCHENIGSKVVFRNDCIQEGKGVIFKDLSKGYNIKELNNSIQIHKHFQKELLIAPVYNIKAEYRCYFTKYDKPQIFSIKQRVNTSSEDELFDKENIQIYKNIQVKWLEIKNNSKTFQMASNIAYKMIRLMSYDTGCLEFALTNEDKIVFFEVNQMAGPLPFEGDDCKNIDKYYNSMIKQMIS